MGATEPLSYKEEAPPPPATLHLSRMWPGLRGTVGLFFFTCGRGSITLQEDSFFRLASEPNRSKLSSCFKMHTEPEQLSVLGVCWVWHCALRTGR